MSRAVVFTGLKIVRCRKWPKTSAVKPVLLFRIGLQGGDSIVDLTLSREPLLYHCVYSLLSRLSVCLSVPFISVM